MTALTPAQARALWASELESGKWKQGTGQLARETDDGWEFCCAGVASELAVRHGIIERYHGEDAGLDDRVQEWLGLSTMEGDYGESRSRCLTSDNDSLVPFKQIAATIRNEPEGLVTT